MKCSFSRGDTWAAIKKYFNRFGIQIIVFRDRENMTRAQEAPLGIFKIFDQNCKKTPNEWDVFQIFDQNDKKIPKESDVFKRLHNHSDLYNCLQIFIKIVFTSWDRMQLQKQLLTETQKNRLLQNKWPGNPLLFLNFLLLRMKTESSDMWLWFSSCSCPKNLPPHP